MGNKHIFTKPTSRISRISENQMGTTLHTCRWQVAQRERALQVELVLALPYPVNKQRGTEFPGIVSIAAQTCRLLLLGESQIV